MGKLTDDHGGKPRDLRGLMQHIDHTVIRPEATREDVAAGLDLGIELGTATVVVRPWEVAWARRRVGDQGPAVCTSISFPHGADTMNGKVSQTRGAISDGAGEVDVVMNVGAFLSGERGLVREEFSAVVEAASGCAVKAIIETGYLTRDQVIDAARLAASAGVAFVKNGTGYSPRGASPEETRLIRDAIPRGVLVKAAGGIRSLEAVLGLMGAGATRIGTSATRAIADEWAAKETADDAMTGSRAMTEIVVRNPTGFHARPASVFVRAAAEFGSDIRLQNLTTDSPAVNAKSVISIITIAVQPGHRVRITATGSDAESAISALTRMIEEGLGEHIE